MENMWENYMQNGKINPVSGIFLGKNNFGYQDKQEMVLTPNTNPEADYNVDDIKKAISLGDAKYMQKFPGIGPKAAQQIILDLRGKIDFEAKPLVSDNLKDCEEALIALGYNKKEVSKVISKLDPNLDTNESIKQGLKLLSKL